MFRPLFIVTALALSASTAHAYLPTLPPTHETIFSTSLSHPNQSGEISKYGFGARYTSSASMSYQNALSSSYSDIMRTNGMFAFYVRLFGTEKLVFRMSGAGYNNRAGTQYFDLSAYSLVWDPLGWVSNDWQQIYTKRFTARYTIPSEYHSVNFFDAEAGPFWVGPIPVTARALAKGWVSWSGNVDFGTGGISATFRPKAGIEARISASVKAGWGDFSLAEAGVRGVLNLISADLPITTSLWTKFGCGGVWGKFGLDFTLDIHLYILALDGYVELFASAFHIAEATYELGDWDAPLSWNMSLVSIANTQCF